MRTPAEMRREAPEGWERKCIVCNDWFPETAEFFYHGRTRKGVQYFLSKCIVCERERKLDRYHAQKAAKGVEVRPKESRTKWPERPLLADLW